MNLELMTARSAGFVAVVTHRPEIPTHECSPFMVHEDSLGFEAHKPRLVLRDKNVSPLYFDAADTIEIEFDRNASHRSDDRLRAELPTFTSRRQHTWRACGIGAVRSGWRFWPATGATRSNAWCGPPERTS